MKCGHCKDEHETVAQVRLCSQRHPLAASEPVREEPPRMRPVRPNEERREAMRQGLFAEVRAVADTIEEGHYAVPGEDGALRFYRVNKGAKGGRWEGRTFIEVQASDDYHRLGGLKTELAVYRKIAANPQEAMLAYGREIGRCGHCNRTLTDETSRARGIGPVCAKNLGWTDLAA